MQVSYNSRISCESESYTTTNSATNCVKAIRDKFKISNKFELVRHALWNKSKLYYEKEINEEINI